MKTFLCLAAALSLGAAAAARPWPDATSRIVVFADQLPGSLSEAQRRFAATRLAGTQKMLRSEIRALRAYNANFLCLHYQLAIGSGPEAFITGDEWGSDWEHVNAQADWFLLNGSERAHQATWNWDVMNVTYSGDAPNTGFPQYWISNALARIVAAEDDGVFADSFTLDGCAFGQCHPTHPWLEDVDLCLANWVPALNSFGRAVRQAFDGDGRGFKFIPNVGALVTGWDATDYGVGHGGMVEGFCFWGPGDYFDVADWELQMGRALGLARGDKIVICQCYPSVAGYSDRMFATASYLLIKGKYTYLNLLAASDVALEYYPEYDLPLGAALAPLPAALEDLYDTAWGVYRRDFANGMALVNPSGAPRTIDDLGASYLLASATGGGEVDENGSFGGALAYAPAGALTLPAHSAAVLLIATNITPTPAAAPVMNDYDGNGISELAVYDNNIGNWYAYNLQTGQAIIWERAWGWPGAGTVPGDYDGDAFSDMAVYDQNTGYWYVWSEVKGQALLWARAWGWPGAETVPGDYDGDAKSDLAVYDQPSGFWYIITLGDKVLAWDRAWGWPGAITVPGDYDGDGIDDLCVYDQNTGYWYVQTLAETVLAWEQPWGRPGATTVPGDYDGDGNADMAVYDQPTGAWYVWSQARQQALIWERPWGWTGAVPVPGDYDGDGNADLAVFDTITGYWYIWSPVKGEPLAWEQPWGWPGANPPGGRQ